MKAVIFDMDGVIVDSEPCHERAFREVLRQIGCGDAGAWRYAEFIGRSDQDLFAAFQLALQPAQSISELLALKRREVIEIIRRERPLYPGLPALVEKLAARYSLAVASGSERPVVEEVLRLGGLGRFFPVVVADSETARGKPAPDIFLRAAELLGVAPSECWAVEDSKPGVAAGLAAGMKVIAITNTHPAEELSEATHVVETYPELEAVLMGGVMRDA
jgi:HAD superfamily hydrolase (TIGR01509 family)